MKRVLMTTWAHCDTCGGARPHRRTIGSWRCIQCGTPRPVGVRRGQYCVPKDALHSYRRGHARCQCGKEARCEKHLEPMIETNPADVENGPDPSDAENRLICVSCEQEQEHAPPCDCGECPQCWQRLITSAIKDI